MLGDNAEPAVGTICGIITGIHSPEANLTMRAASLRESFTTQTCSRDM